MIREVIVEGRTIDEAISKGSQLLGIDIDDVSKEILEVPQKGFLGFGAVNAKLRVYFDDGAPEPEIPASKVKTEKAVAKTESAKYVSKDKAPKNSFVSNTAPTEKEQKASVNEVEKFLNGLFDRMDLNIDVKSELVEDGQSLNVTLTGEKVGIIIGRRGETLDALQYLSNLVTNRDAQSRIKVRLDSEDYRAKREEALTTLAKRVADKVIKSKHSSALEPMNANERRIIHASLQEFKGITTYSVGEEPRRRIVIAPQGFEKENRSRNNINN